MEWLPPRQSCRTAVMKEQEEGGGMAQEVDTPAPAAVGAASVTTSRQRVS